MDNKLAHTSKTPFPTWCIGAHPEGREGPIDEKRSFKLSKATTKDPCVWRSPISTTRGSRSSKLLRNCVPAIHALLPSLPDGL